MNKEHHFTIEDAISYGIEKAILLYNIRFWLDKNKANGTNINKKNGKEYYWTYNSSTAFSELFPYLNDRSIRRWLQELEKDDIIITSNFNKKGYDKTKWYTMPQYELKALNSQSNGQIDQPMTQNDQPIPDNKQQIVNTDIPIVSDVPSEPDLSLVKPIQEVDKRTLLPSSFGKQSIERLAKLYNDLWKIKYGSPQSMFDYGRFGKSAKRLLSVYTEVQIAIIMFTYFDWKGIRGDNQAENDFLLGIGFTIEAMLKKVDIYVLYAKEARNINFDDIEASMMYVGKTLRDNKLI